MTPEITKEIAIRVLQAIAPGLTCGKGQPEPGKMCVEAAVCYAMGLPHSDEPPCVAPDLRTLKIRLNDAEWSSNEARAKGLRRLAVAQLGSAGELDEKEFVSRLVDYAIRVSTPQALRSAASVIKDEKHKAALCEAADRCEKEGTGDAARGATVIAKNVGNANAANVLNNAISADRSGAVSYAIAAVESAYAGTVVDPYAVPYAAIYAATNSADTYAATYAAKKTARDNSLAAYAEAVVQILIELKAPGCQWLALTEAA